MKLHDILDGMKLLEVLGSLDVEINEIQFDSRKVGKGDVFVAVKGTQVDGHRFLSQVMANGAAAIVVEAIPADVPNDVTVLKVKNSATALGCMAASCFGHPSRQLKLVGITGTNGKTSTATLLYELFMSLGYKAGLLSTIENKVGHRALPSTHTTPNAVELNRLLAEMVESGCDYAFMEVSSHAIHQQRIAGVEYAGAVFTNLSHDHLDYHETFKAYIEAKKLLFDTLPKTAFALVNVDDRRGEVMLQNTKADKQRYSLRQLADFKAKIIENSLLGLHLNLDGNEFYGRLVGEFNAYNTLAIYATAILLEQDKMEVLTALSQLKSAAGRFETLVDKTQNITTIVDYAHTPDALEKVLTTINAIKKSGKILTVVGCGGDRDKSKRPKMAQIACIKSEQVILTSDNPRTEDPKQILDDMEAGIPDNAVPKVLIIEDRKQAIRTACRLAQSGDIVLVAGKGHENYQEINGVKHPFDDKEVLKEALAI